MAKPGAFPIIVTGRANSSGSWLEPGVAELPQQE